MLRYLNNISVWWHAVGTTALIIAILAAAPSHQSAKFVFQTFIDGTGGWGDRASHAYVVVVSVSLAPQTVWQFSGFRQTESSVTDWHPDGAVHTHRCASCPLLHGFSSSVTMLSERMTLFRFRCECTCEHLHTRSPMTVQDVNMRVAV